MTGSEEVELVERFRKIQQRAQALGITGKQLSNLPSVKALKFTNATKKGPVTWVKKVAKCIGGMVVLLWVVLLVEWPVERETMVKTWFEWGDMDYDRQPCLVELAESVIDFARPPVDCSMCRGMTEVDKVTNLTQDMFESKYAYSGVPVVIEDGAQNWTAIKTFNFNFFKGIYSDDSPVLQNVESNCQFFPYKTEFGSLAEVFDMSPARAQMKDGSKPWYIGWSNCDSSAANILRQHYDRPYFLPRVAESSKTDWIFMGSPGYGAHMHIDNVGNPSWQAQITGTKRWTLEPPPECYYECDPKIDVIVRPGEIIVLDTNIWFHSTLILGKDMSITIGSEYD